MSFFSGSLTFTRFQATGFAPSILDERHLSALAEHTAGRQRLASADGIELGWTASEHILDTQFELAKNIINDMLFFSMRIDSNNLPADILKAYYLIDLKALCADNPSGKPSKRQKREAKESSRERLEHEAKDGRFLKRKAVEIIMDRPNSELYFGTTSLTMVDRMAHLLKRTFDGVTLDIVTAGRQALDAGNVHLINDLRPAPFVPGLTPDDVAWIVDESSRDFLGNEFLLWLWHVIETQSDTFPLKDGSEVAVMFARSLVLDCPRGQTGVDGFKHEGPTRLPEARRALQAGKMPRKAGLTLVRHGKQYECTLHAESLAISGAKLPKGKEEDDRARLDERADLLRSFIETIDLLYESFVSVRLSSQWHVTLAEMQGWLKRSEKARAA